MMRLWWKWVIMPGQGVCKGGENRDVRRSGDIEVNREKRNSAVWKSPPTSVYSTISWSTIRLQVYLAGDNNSSENTQRSEKNQNKDPVAYHRFYWAFSEKFNSFQCSLLSNIDNFNRDLILLFSITIYPNLFSYHHFQQLIHVILLTDNVYISSLLTIHFQPPFSCFLIEDFILHYLCTPRPQRYSFPIYPLTRLRRDFDKPCSSLVKSRQNQRISAK